MMHERHEMRLGFGESAAVAAREAGFFVAGDPKPAGSKRPFLIRNGRGEIVTGKGGAPVINQVDMSGKPGKVWRAAVAWAGKQAMGPWAPFDGPVALEVLFTMPRPKYHYSRLGAVRPDAPFWHLKAPDATKLLRALEDALKGICWIDDCQVVRQEVLKTFGEKPGAHVKVRTL